MAHYLPSVPSEYLWICTRIIIKTILLSPHELQQSTNDEDEYGADDEDIPEPAADGEANSVVMGDGEEPEELEEGEVIFTVDEKVDDTAMAMDEDDPDMHYNQSVRQISHSDFLLCTGR